MVRWSEFITLVCMAMKSSINVIGQDISSDMAQCFRDPQTQDMYTMSFMEAGKAKTYFMKRDKWDGLDPFPWTGTDCGLKRSAAAVSSRN